MAEYSTISCLFSLLWLFDFFGYTLAQCYYPGGAWAADHIPCNQSAFTSFCCLQGWTCFSNDLCIATDPSIVSSALTIGTSYRGTCTNPNWNTSACGNFCLNDPVNDNSGALVSCGQNKWCCEPDYNNGNCNCQNGDGTFSVSNGHALTIIGVNNLVHTATAASEPVHSTSTATTSTATTSSSGRSSTTSSTSSTTASGTHTSPPSPGPTKPSTQFVIGMSAGFGVLAFLLIVSLCFAYYRMSVRRGTFRFWAWRRGIGGSMGMAGQPPVIPRYEPPITRDNPYLAHMESNPFHNSTDSIELG